MYSHDHPKYKRVEEKLRAYKFSYTHLHPDSVDLVEKLLNEYEKMFKKFQEAKSSKPKTQPRIADLEHQLDLINQLNHQLKKQNQSLRTNTKQNGIQDKIKALQSTLNNCRLGYEQKLDQLNEMVQRSQRTIQEGNREKRVLADQNQKLKKILASSQQQTESSTYELTALLQKKKKCIEGLQEENTKYRYEIGELERMYEAEKQSKSLNQTEKIKKNNTLIQVLREEVSDLQKRLGQADRNLQAEKQTNKDLKQAINRLNEEINRLKCQQDYAMNSYSIENNAKSKLENMYGQARNELSEVVEERNRLKVLRQEDQQQIQRQNRKIKDLINKNNNYKAKQNKLGEQFTVLNNNFLQKVRELRESQNVKAGLERKIKDLQRELSEAGENIAHKIDSSPYEQQCNKKLIIYEKEMEVKRNELKVMHENQHNILMEKTKLQAELKKLQNIIGEGNKQLEVMQNQKEMLMKQNKELKNIIDSSQTEGYTKNSQIHRHKETIQSYEIMIQDLRVAIRNQQNNNKIYAQKIGQLEKKIQGEKQSNKQLHQDNKQLKLMVESVTKTKDELFHKYKNVSDEKAVTDNRKIEQIKDYNELQSEKNKLAAEVQQKTLSLLTLNNSYDELQNILDDKTIQNEQLKGQINKLQKELHVYGKGLGERQIDMQGMTNKIRGLQNTVQKMQKQYQRACSELNDCHYEINNRNTEIQSLKNQIKLIVLNNKEVQKECEKLRLITQDSDKKLKERIEEVDEQRELASSYKIQNQNLMEELKIEKEENRKLQNYMKEVAEENNNIYNNLTQRDSELKGLSDAYRQAQFKEEQYLQEIKYYEKQLRQLGDDMEKKDEEIRRLAQDRDIYRAEVTCSRRSSNVDMKYHLEERLQNCQNDYELKKRECERLRMELREYEKVIEEERQRNFFLQQRLDQSRNMEGTQTPIKRFTKSRVQSENWNGYNRELSQIDNSVDLKESKRVEQSFESDYSAQSKAIGQKLQKIYNAYQATITVYHKGKK